MGLQRKMSGGVFGCARWSAFCTAMVWPCTSLLRIKALVPVGGKWKTALNAGPFKALWAKVLSEGNWRKHPWTAKVDLDTVFFPWRLIPHLTKVSSGSRKPPNVFFLNSHCGLHGPIEILSRAAVAALGNPAEGWGM